MPRAAHELGAERDVVSVAADVGAVALLALQRGPRVAEHAAVAADVEHEVRQPLLADESAALGRQAVELPAVARRLLEDRATREVLDKASSTPWIEALLAREGVGIDRVVDVALNGAQRPAWYAPKIIWATENAVSVSKVNVPFASAMGSLSIVDEYRRAHLRHDGQTRAGDGLQVVRIQAEVLEQIPHDADIDCREARIRRNDRNPASGSSGVGRVVDAR